MMTQTFGANQNNDIYIGANGNLVVLQKQAAVSAACASTSKASLGEEVLSINSGLPFFQAVFVGVPNLSLFENYLRTALEKVDGVIAVTNLSVSLDKVNGKSILNYTATIENEYGLKFVISQGIPSP